jgi:hypothetical protein
MSIPVQVLLGFAAWTLLTLFGSIGAYRWSRICAQALFGINQRRTLTFVRMSTLEHYDFVEKIAFV